MHQTQTPLFWASFPTVFQLFQAKPARNPGEGTEATAATASI